MAPGEKGFMGDGGKKFDFLFPLSSIEKGRDIIKQKKFTPPFPF
jgi:hypothetical protein